MTLQRISIGLMLSNFHFFLGPLLSGIKQILKFEIFQIQFLETTCSKKLDQNLSPLYNFHNPSGIKLLTRLRLGLSYLNEHKFNHNFDDCVNPFCTCSLEPESTSHFFLHCHHYNAIQSILFEDLNSVDKNLFKLSDNELTLILLYGSTKYSLMNNRILLNSSIKYIENSKRFSGPLFQCSGIFS